jgi:hypothetical protein
MFFSSSDRLFFERADLGIKRASFSIETGSEYVRSTFPPLLAVSDVPLNKLFFSLAMPSPAH